MLDNIPQCTIDFESNVRLSPEEAVDYMKNVSRKIAPDCPLHYNRIVITSKLELWTPGIYNRNYPGDYLLTWGGKAPKHIDICDAIVDDINNNRNENSDYYRYWLELLEDVYNNGTQNIKSDDEKDNFKRQLIFWVTLQEDINRKEKLGRLTPFCRYAEAIATTIDEYPHTYKEVIIRLDCKEPEFLEKWDIPYAPEYYGWSAF